jgi:dihydrofolate synthase/folylpolyglutamate synthase
MIERPLVTAIANLALDHQQFLGSGLTDIAAEKAAIAKPGAPLITQLYPPAVASRVAKVAHERGAFWLPRGGEWDAIVRQGRLHYRDGHGELNLPLPRLPGRHQAMNAALAIAILRHQDEFRAPPTALSAAMGWADWPARLQRLAPGPLVDKREVWLDGGHNPSAARQIASFARHEFADGKPLHLVFASLSTKDPGGMLEPFKDIAASVLTVPIPDHGSFSPDDLVEVAAEFNLSAEPFENFEQAVASVPSDARVLIFGSLYLAGAVLAANDQLPA